MVAPQSKAVYNNGNMRKLNQHGLVNPLVIPLVLAVLILIVASVMAVLYYTKFVEQRDRNQPLIEAAVTEAEAVQQKKLEAEFIEREKLPTKSYTSPAEFGSVKLVFPKTWSSMVAIGKTSEIDYYGHPGYVPESGVNYALRMSVVREAFAEEVKDYDDQVKKGELKATAVRVSGVTGVRLDGLLDKDQEGSMLIFPLRDKTLRVWTESKEFRSDFDNIVLKGLTFVP